MARSKCWGLALVALLLLDCRPRCQSARQDARRTTKTNCCQVLRAKGFRGLCGAAATGLSLSMLNMHLCVHSISPNWQIIANRELRDAKMWISRAVSGRLVTLDTDRQQRALVTGLPHGCCLHSRISVDSVGGLGLCPNAAITHSWGGPCCL